MNNDELELINAGVDDELDAAGRVRLDALLAGSEQARDLYDGLQRLGTFLEQVPPVEPPSALHGRIVNSISLPRPTAPGLKGLFNVIPGLLRYGLAAGLAVVVTMAVYQGGSQLNGVDYDKLVGTISARGAELDRFEFNQDGAQGSVRILERGDTYALEFELQARRPVLFDVDFADSGLRFDALAQADLNLDELALTKTTLSARTEGSQRFVVLMRPVAPGSPTQARISIALSQDGESIGRGVLDTGRDR